MLIHMDETKNDALFIEQVMDKAYEDDPLRRLLVLLCFARRVAQFPWAL